MVVAFKSPVHWEAQQAPTRERCEEMGIKVAKRTRVWSERQRHRRVRALAAAPAAPDREQPPVNWYEPIADESTVSVTREVKIGPPGTRRKRQIRERRAKRRRTTPAAGSARAKRRALLREKLTRAFFRVGTLNVQGGLVNSIGEYEDYARRHGYDVLALQETRLNPKTKLLAQGYKVFRPEADREDEQHGVLLLVANHLAVGATVEKTAATNQLWVRISGVQGRRNMYICSAYMPQESAPARERKAAFNALKSSAAGYACKGDVIILGDLNAKTSSAITADEKFRLGPHGAPGRRSGNGKLLMEVLVSADLVNLIGHCAPREGEHWWSRRDTRTSARSLIDYVLVSKGLLPRLSAGSITPI
jgi:exonuclease III